MDTLTIILATVAIGSFVALAFLGGYELGEANGSDNERTPANRRVNALLDELNKYKPKLRYRKVDARKVGKRRASK